MLKLVQPTAGVFDTWFRESTDRQAEDRAWALGGDVETHRAQVSAMIPQLLPDGKDTPGHTFRIAQTEEGTDIAFVWFGTVPGMPSNAARCPGCRRTRGCSSTSTWRRSNVGRGTPARSSLGCSPRCRPRASKRSPSTPEGTMSRR